MKAAKVAYEVFLTWAIFQFLITIPALIAYNYLNKVVGLVIGIALGLWLLYFIIPYSSWRVKNLKEDRV